VVDRVVDAISAVAGPLFNRLKAETVMGFCTFGLTVFVICYMGPTFSDHIDQQILAQREHDSSERRQTREMFAQIVDQIERAHDRQFEQLLAEIRSLREILRDVK
jgi:hypothetical protein